MPTLINDALKHQPPSLLSEALKDYLPFILKESLKTYIQAISKQFAEKQTQLHKKLANKMNKQFHLAHHTESEKFIVLQKELTKVLQSDMGQTIKSQVRSGIKDVREDLNTQKKYLTKYCLFIQDMQNTLQEV
ncbi:hypothetical protein Tco_0254848 [Tanacetum coccineum]